MSHIYKRAMENTHECVMSNTYGWVTLLIHMCDTTHSYVWHDSFICVTWLIHMCDMTHSYMWHDSLICVRRRIHMWDMTPSYVCHDSFTCVPRPILFAPWLYGLGLIMHDIIGLIINATHCDIIIRIFICVPWLIWICRKDIHKCTMTHYDHNDIHRTHDQCHSLWHDHKDIHMCTTPYLNMGWLRLVGSLKLQVSFAKEPYKRDDILQKRPIILRSLLIVATPYVVIYKM